MEYFLFQGLNAVDQVRFDQFIASQGLVFRRQVDFDFGDQRFGFHLNQPAAGAFEAMRDGSIKLNRKAGQPNLRVRMSPMWEGDSQRWRYLRLNQPYRFEFDFYLYNRGDNHRGVDWANLFEIWGPYDGQDAGRNPAFEVMLRGKKGEFEFRQRGDSRRSHDRNYEYQKATSVPFRQGSHRLVVDTVLSYAGKGSTKVWFNGDVVFDESNITNTYNSDPFGDGVQMGGLINFPEIYCPESSVAAGSINMSVKRIRVSDEIGTTPVRPKAPSEPSQPPAPTKPEPTGKGDFSASLKFTQKPDGTYDVTGKLELPS